MWFIYTVNKHLFLSTTETCTTLKHINKYPKCLTLDIGI